MKKNTSSGYRQQRQTEEEENRSWRRCDRLWPESVVLVGLHKRWIFASMEMKTMMASSVFFSSINWIKIGWRWQPQQTGRKETTEKHERKRRRNTQVRTGTGYALRDRTGQRETSHFPCGPLAAHHGPSRALFPFVHFYVFTSLIIRQATWLLPYMVSSK